ncbi:methylthioribulose 1-phosphate dehydratase [Xylanibacillus composti]|uniref:Methylthioribulose-1-phosphate dehydratase n=1 Tax=Xylanibacillus composti TaxID=1572762 RepID=A0A8J4M087_9BACL|nr:methylthioribulose 1-phosphate dehydratase [Xylanibacillus composti]MDT9725511.1 methylthioribulose 1-phosphate dehydratase [Xylanibacillus composti]GIQ67605.1 methylthioribulose-1-phosphate dehydratase [Xylanibacillus composti]
MTTSYTAEDRQRVFAQLAADKAVLASKGWFPATSGNMSIRLGDEPASAAAPSFHFAITASGKDKSVNTPEDFLLVNEQGKPVETTSLRPSAETLIHCEIYRLTGCGAVYHVHTVYNNLISERFGDQGSVAIKGVELIKAFNIWEEDAEIHIPILPNYADIPKIAALVEGALNRAVPGILLRNHGIYAWGETPFEAKRHLEAFEFLFEYEYRRLALQA